MQSESCSALSDGLEGQEEGQYTVETKQGGDHGFLLQG